MAKLRWVRAGPFRRKKVRVRVRVVEFSSNEYGKTLPFFNLALSHSREQWRDRRRRATAVTASGTGGRGRRDKHNRSRRDSVIVSPTAHARCRTAAPTDTGSAEPAPRGFFTPPLNSGPAPGEISRPRIASGGPTASGRLLLRRGGVTVTVSINFRVDALSNELL